MPLAYLDASANLIQPRRRIWSMAVLFVSHSSKDDTAAMGLESWLRVRGFTDLFIDHSNIAGGEKWAQALREAAGACRVIICFVTEHWLASDECFGEFKAAWYMGKRIIPLVALGSGDSPLRGRLAKVLAEDQGFDVAACMNAEGRLDLSRDSSIERRLEAGLRAAGALAEIGLDPEAFAIDRTMHPIPFPGLAAFGDDDADAALFYGRSREIAESLEELRKVHAEGDLRPLVILGASGAGKSSLLKAGIIPRLRRETPAWLPLRAFRPGADPLLNFAEALARTLGDFGQVEAPGVVRDRLLSTWFAARNGGELTSGAHATLAAALEAEGRKLRVAADRREATILVSVDQAEEIARAQGDSGEALADYLRAALASAASKWQLAFTIRTDSFPELQSHRRFQNLNARGYDLRALPVFRFASVIEEPAKRYGVSVDRVLADALMEDAPKEDALPLLAFALQRLWRQYGAATALTRSNYDKVGGLKGLIEDAAERALHGLAPDEDTPLPSGTLPKHRVDLAASTFVPALVQINDRGATIRRIALWRSFSDEQQDLLIRFDQWRLVVRKGGADGGTVEVVHEVLLREWARLKAWLEPERARLESMRLLQLDASVWNRNGRDATFVIHRDKRLAEAVTLASIDSYRKRLGTVELAYLAACQEVERQGKERRTRFQILVGALALAVVYLIGWVATYSWGELSREDIISFQHKTRQNWQHLLSEEDERALKPGSPFKECAEDCPGMIVIPAGSFVMGSQANEKVRSLREEPQHKVTIGRPFAISVNAVTFVDWDLCVVSLECSHISDSGFIGRQQPVINVSWDDAKRYVSWVSKMTGKTYRLLTEAEYEYAARAGTQTAYPWGDDIKMKGTVMANCNGCGSEWDNRRPAPFGSFPANRFHLKDMVGNVAEWVEDCVHTDYNGAPEDGSAWINGGDCSSHVVRGGSWRDLPEDLRLFNRLGISATARLDTIGFRIGRTLLPP
jgi:formylglycine-generating enzyme required for sulfatase activity